MLVSNMQNVIFAWINEADDILYNNADVGETTSWRLI